MGVGMGLGQQGRLETVYLFIFYFYILFIFDCAGPPLPRGLSPSYGERGLLCCHAWVSQCGGFSCAAWVLAGRLQ